MAANQLSSNNIGGSLGVPTLLLEAELGLLQLRGERGVSEVSFDGVCYVTGKVYLPSSPRPSASIGVPSSGRSHLKYCGQNSTGMRLQLHCC
jgi:hypothetical protein